MKLNKSKVIAISLMVSVMLLNLTVIIVQTINNNKEAVHTVSEQPRVEEMPTKDAPADETDTLKEDIDVNELKTKKLIALTFDDGPHKTYTNEVLDVLKKENVKATFFVVGYMAKYYPNTVKRIVEEGHQIGIHTYNHKDLTKLSKKQVIFEINETNKAIKDITDVNATAIRPPYGAINKTVKENANLPIILWSVDPEDWKKKDAKKISKAIVSTVKDGDIILLHDVYSTTVEGTEKAIKKLKKEGYTFVTVDTLIKVRQGKVENNKVYYNVK